MTTVAQSGSTRLIFREAPHGITIAQFRAAIDGINNAYEVLAIASLPGYENYPLTDRVAPRVHSRLIAHDELHLDAISFGSPLDLLLQGLPYVLSALTGYLGGSVKGVLKDGGDSLANLVNLRENARSNKEKYKADAVRHTADAAEHQLRLERAQRSLEALRATGRGGAGGHSTEALPQPADYYEEAPIDTLGLADDLVKGQLKKVTRVAGAPEVLNP
ncbi:hypothetical protein [Mycolicibacterium pulveris]|uniref:hypothetical protein n=1 Tax=Mycolicibacterium pulveris TaxID=36813 RepID=UPI003CEC5C58